jgi:fumarate reductase flavoprotein subunit
MRIFSTFLILASLFLVSVGLSHAQKAGEINKPHLESGLDCKDCHEADVPEKRAPQTVCIECHSDKTDAAPISFKDISGKDYNISPHASHAGQMRCTLCHKIHGSSELYCNLECHGFVLTVP